MTQFVHLHVHSAYSLAEGAIRTKELVKFCADNKMPAVAVTDTNNMFGALEFALEAKGKGIQPIMGAQVNVGPERSQLTLLVQSEQGYRNICRLLSDAYMHGDGTQEFSISYDELKQFSSGLICLTGGVMGPVNQALLHGQNDTARELLSFLHESFGDRLYIEIQRHGWPDEVNTEEAMLDMAYELNIPVVATNDCYFPRKENHEAHDALLCISGGRYITEEDRRKVTPEHYLKSGEQMADLFKDLPEAIENTALIAQRCHFFIEPIKPLLPPFDTEGGRNEEEELTAQAKQGLDWRLDNFVLKNIPAEKHDETRNEYHERLDYELGIIIQMGFPGYFLICSDFIKWAKEHNIPVGPGRGSGAGSLVAWSLKITDLDPIALNLLFERFLNPERVSMPDFDIDFCQSRRDEVIKYVQDKYGHDSVAQIITFGKLQARAVVRDVGRVLQMPYGVVDRIAKMIPNNPANPTTLEEALAGDEDLRKLRDSDDTHKKLIDVALQLEGLYRHASTHAAGVVIGDRPLHELIPLYRDPKSDMPVTQFNMKYVEQAGLVKFDFLGLKTMTVIQKSVDLIKETEGIEIDVLKIPMDDKPSYELMAKGNTVGVFQLESAGMRDALRKIRPDNFEDIIALVSLYRPGPMDNIPSYALRKDGKEEFDTMHDKLQDILGDTYGIMIYQEQVMQAAQILAGYTLGGADLLRRAMGKKIQAEMDAQRKMFVDGAAEHNNVPAKKAEEIFDNINKFAGYGFNKSHAAAYALIAYWTAWLKANYPVQFMAASMTLDLGNTDKLAIFKQDIDKQGMKLFGPDLNHSYPDFAVEGEGENRGVRYALGALKGVGAAAMQKLVEERAANGSYKDLNDFASRLDPKAMNKRQFERMAAAGVFDAINDNRAQVIKGGEIILRHAQSLAEEREAGQSNLFGGGDDAVMAMPALPEAKQWTPLEQLTAEFQAVGFYLSAHPLDTRLEQLHRLGVKTYLDVEQGLMDTPALRAQMAGVLLKKQERVSAKGNKFAFIQLSDPTGVYEVMLFSDILNASREMLETGEGLLLTVEAESQEEQIRFTVQKIERLDEALEGKIQEIRIEMDHAQAFPKIKEFLEIETHEDKRGRSRLRINMRLDDGRVVDMVLPGYWNLSAQARDIIRAEAGIRAIAET